MWEFDSWGVDLPAALRLLAAEVGGDAVTPGVNCGGVFARPRRPPLPTGKLTAAALCQAVAALQPPGKDCGVGGRVIAGCASPTCPILSQLSTPHSPATPPTHLSLHQTTGAIVVDESLTSGASYWDASAGCPQFSHLTLTGGAIGAGIPMAVGAAVACPARVVINLQADGSGMYSLQGLWTQAREGLKVITVVCSNRTYAILKVEMARERITPRWGHTQAWPGRWWRCSTAYSLPWLALAACLPITARAPTALAAAATARRRGR